MKCCSDTSEAYDVLSHESIDLLFLETQFPALNGIDFIKSLAHKPMVIFVTRQSQYAIEAFRVAAVDYLMKPYEVDQLRGSAQRAYELHKVLRIDDLTNNSPHTIDDSAYIFVKSEYKILRIKLSDILYIESMSEYVRIYVVGEPKPILTLLSMLKIEQALPASNILRVHRSYIVNMAKVVEVSRMRIIFDKDHYIPVGDSYKESFLAFIDQYYIGKE